MASVKNGLSENIKGRLGNVIFYSRLGRTYARLRPPKGHDPWYRPATAAAQPDEGRHAVL